jgi:WD40 repeat protein
MWATWWHDILGSASGRSDKKLVQACCVAGLVGLALLALFLRSPAVQEAEDCVVLQEFQEGEPFPKAGGTTGWIEALSFSPDGSLLACGWGQDQSVGVCQLWDVARRQVRAVLPTASAVFSTAFAPDGQLLALGSWDGSVTLWEWASQREPRRLRLASVPVLALAFSPDGTVLAAGMPHAVVLWDLPGGRPRSTLPAECPLAFSPDGHTLATGEAGAAGACLWDWRTGQARGCLQGAPANAGPIRDARVLALAFASEGKILLSSDTATVLRRWEVEAQQLRAMFADDTEPAAARAFSADGRLLATAGAERTVVLREATANRRQATLQGHTGAIYCLAFAPDGRTLVSGGFDGSVRLWKLSAVLPAGAGGGHAGAALGGAK